MTAQRKVAYRREHTGTFAGDQQQRQAQRAAAQVNTNEARLQALENRAYAALATDTTLGVAYATLLTASITTVLASGFLVISFTASGLQSGAALAGVFFQVLVDGAIVKGAYTTVTGAGYAFSVALTVRVAVAKTSHTIVVQAKGSAGAVHINPKTIVEEHAHLLVQEAA